VIAAFKLRSSPHVNTSRGYAETRQPVGNQAIIMAHGEIEGEIPYD